MELLEGDRPMVSPLTPAHQPTVEYLVPVTLRPPVIRRCSPSITLSSRTPHATRLIFFHPKGSRPVYSFQRFPDSVGCPEVVYRLLAGRDGVIVVHDHVPSW